MRALLSVALVLAVGTPARATALGRDPVIEQYERAEKAHAEGRYLEASAAWFRVLELIDNGDSIDIQSRTTVVLSTVNALCEAVSHGQTNAARLGEATALLNDLADGAGQVSPEVAAARRQVESLQRVHQSADNAEDLFAQGQDAFDAGRFAMASEHWRESLRQLDGRPRLALATREAVLLSLVTALTEAAILDNSEGDVALKEALSLLNTQVELAGGTSSPGVNEARGKVENLLRRSNEAAAPVEPAKPLTPQPAPANTITRDAGPPAAGRNAIMAGSGLVVLGVGAGVWVPLGIHEFGQLDRDPDEDSKRSHRLQATMMVSVGSVLFASLVGAGTVLIVKGISQRRQSKLAVAPFVTPQTAGFTLGGQF